MNEDMEGRSISKCEFDEVNIISFKDIRKYMGRRDCIIIDLRSREEYKESHIKGAVNIEYRDGRLDIPDERKNDLLVFYCDSGERALMAAGNMKRLGYRTIAVAGRFIR